MADTPTTASSPAGTPADLDLWRPPDWRRGLQLALAGLWMLDGLLQLQPFFFTGGRHGFDGMLAANAPGNPGWVAHSITWNAGVVGHHAQVTDALFAAVQILLGLGIAWRPTVKPALAASMVWSLAVWWFGEGLGGVFRGVDGSPLAGGPGAVLFYGLLAVLLWPVPEGVPARGPRPSAASAAVGGRVAAAVWMAVWLGMAALVLGTGRAPQSVFDVVAQASVGEPGWLAAVDRHTASLVAHRGLGAAALFAVLFALVALSVLLPRPWARAGVALALVVALVLWVFTENFGMIFPGGATDPNSGPLLVLLALAYWPLGPGAAGRRAESRRARPGLADSHRALVAGAP